MGGGGVRLLRKNGDAHFPYRAYDCCAAAREQAPRHRYSDIQGGQRPNLSVLLVASPCTTTDTEHQHSVPVGYSLMPSPREILLRRYRYDALDRLTANASPNEPEHQRFYCKSRLATEIQGAVRYSFIQDDNLLLAQQQDDGNTRSTTLLITDQQRSVLDTLKPNQPRQSMAYSPYGHHSYSSGLLSLLTFNGERPDPVTGCYLLGNGHRTFNPLLMRFISPDDLSPLGKGGINAYGYCLGDPINKSDPSGRVTVQAFAHAFKTRMTNIKAGGLDRRIRPGISTGSAMRARDKIFKIDEKIARYNKKSQEDYALNSFNREFREPHNLQAHAMDNITLNKTPYPKEGYPSRLKEAISHRRSAQKFILDKLARTQKGSDVISSLHDFIVAEKYIRPSRTSISKKALQLAEDIYEKIFTIRSPKEMELLERREALVNQYFL